MSPKLKQANKTTPAIKWLFTAHFDDGSVIKQDQLDKAETGDGSRFRDVLKKDGLTSFWLDNSKEVVGVDLVNGNFLVNGLVVQLHGQYFEPEKYDLELVYFRETRIEQSLDAKTGEEIGRDHFINRTFIGWKATVNKWSKQYTVAVS